jgi:hypothetical protein
MKELKSHTIQKGDDFISSYSIKWLDKNIVFCIKDDNEELLYQPFKKNWDVYTIELDEDLFDALDKGKYTYSIRIQDKPRTTIGKGSLTIE